MKLFPEENETVNNFLWRSLQVFSKGSVTFLIFFISAKFLEPIEFGLFGYLMAVVGLLTIFCDFGLSTAVSKFVAECKARQSEKLDSILFSVSTIAITISMLISVAVILFGSRIFKNNYRYILYFLPYLFFMPLTSIVDGMYRGLKQFRRLALISLFIAIFCLLISFILIKQFFLIGTIFSQNILYFLLAVFLYGFQKNLSLRFDKILLIDVVKYALILGVSGVAYFLYTRVDILILKQFGFMVEIGYYQIINRTFHLLLIPFVILGQVIAPNITEYITVGSIAKIKDQLKGYAVRCVIAGLTLSVLLYFGIPVVLDNLLPKYYTVGFLLIMNILLALLPFKIWGTFLTHGFITPSGFAKIVTITTLVGGVINVIADYIFISIFGFIGVFWVTLVIHSMSILTVSLYYYSKIGRETAKPRVCDIRKDCTDNGFAIMVMK
jgi:O-antigen/teichoic acid export membrane protein